LRDLRTLDGVALEPVPPSLSAEVADLLLGIASTPTGTVRVLDAKAIISAEPLRALAKRDEEGKS
jgi:hypothetical protein